GSVQRRRARLSRWLERHMARTGGSHAEPASGRSDDHRARHIPRADVARAPGTRGHGHVRFLRSGPRPEVGREIALGWRGDGDAALVPRAPGPVPQHQRRIRTGDHRQRLQRGRFPDSLHLLSWPGTRCDVRRTIVCLLGLTLAAAQGVRAADYRVSPGGANKVVFTSKAPTETFEGKTNKIEGVLSLDPGAVGDSIHAHLEAPLDVDLASLDTGIGKRNQLMRRDHLECDKYPKAIFDGATVLTPGKIEAGKTTTFEIEGTFSIHGVSRRLR